MEALPTDGVRRQEAEKTVEHSASSDSQRSQTFHEEEPLAFTEAEEAALVRRLDLRVLTLVSALFMLSFLDRSNAKTAGLVEDLGLTSGQFQNCLTLFYVGYVVGQPGTLLWKYFQPRYYVAVLTFLWGALALIQAAVSSYGGLAAIRVLLGVAETAFAPGVTYYLSFFYRRREIGLRQGLYLGAAPIATAYAGALAYGLTHVNDPNIANWKLLFLVEGAPAILMVPVVYFFLPNKATQARFLSQREKDIARERFLRDGNTGHDEKLEWRNVLAAFKDYKAIIHALCYFSANVSYSSLPLFLPTILTEMGFTSIRAQGLTAPPYLASFIVIVCVSFLSDRIGDRSAFIIPCAFVGGVGYLILAVAKTTAARYTAVYLVACGIFPVIGLLLPWVANTHQNDSKRGAGFMLLNLIGQCGPFLGTRLYPAKDGPHYVKGMGVCCAFIWFVGALSLLLRFLLIRENKKLDAIEASSGYDKEGKGSINSFRYSL